MTNKRRVKRWPAFVAATISLVLLAGAPALALDKGDKNPDGTPHAGRLFAGLSQCKQVNGEYECASQTKSYSAVVSQTPNGSVNVVNPNRCRTVTYCDVIRVDVDPGGTTDPYGFTVTLNWPEPKESVDMDIRIFEPVFAEDDPETEEDESRNPDGSKKEASTRRIGLTLGQSKPERLLFGVDSEAGYYYMCIVNINDPGAKATGQNLGGYDLSVQMRFDDLSCPECTAPKSPAPRSSPKPSISSPKRTFTPPSPTPTLSPVKVPGPNGELRTFNVTVLSAGDQRPAGPKGPNPLLIGVISVLLIGLAAFLFFFLKGRRAGEV